MRLRLHPVSAALAAIGGLAGTPALAEPGPGPTVSLDSAIYVEHVVSHGAGPRRSLEPANRLSHGDRVVTLLTWYRLGGSGAFTITNALPRGLDYQKSAEGNEQVSVDGGRNWGQLGTLRVGGRLATAEDITHVRWRVSAAEALNGSGAIAYAGFVR